MAVGSELLQNDRTARLMDELTQLRSKMSETQQKLFQIMVGLFERKHEFGVEQILELENQILILTSELRELSQ